MEKNILICLEKMGTGGVETFVLTQAIELKRRGFNVFVMAKDGEYVKSLKNYGIEWIEESFELEDKFDFNKSLKIYNVLDIYGDGAEKDEIKKYVEEQNINGYEINILNGTNQVNKVMEEHDVIMGLGRCMLEAIAMKRLTIISGNAGNEPLKYIVKPENIIESIENDFAYKDLKRENVEDIIKDLSNYNKENLKQIVENNYKIIEEKLDIKNNIYVVEEPEGIQEKSWNVLEIILQTEQEQYKQLEQKHNIGLNKRDGNI